MYLLVSLLVYLVPFLFAAFLILLVVALPALANSFADKRKTLTTRPEPTAHAVKDTLRRLEQGLVGSPGVAATHFSKTRS